MSNITPINLNKQVKLDEKELKLLLEFVSQASKAFEEVSALLTVIQEKTEEGSLLRLFADMASEKADQWEKGCLCFENTQVIDKIKEEKLGIAA